MNHNYGSALNRSAPERDPAMELLLREAAKPKQVMVCKLQLHSVDPVVGYDSKNAPMPGGRVRFGAVWEGSTEKQQASENVVFGHWTPCAEFTASIMNTHVIEQLQTGKKYYVTFTEAPD